MFNKKLQVKRTALREIQNQNKLPELRDVQLAMVGGGSKGWNPSWTAPQDPDDIFRDDH